VVRHVAAGGLASLPGPVQRYLRAVLPEIDAMVKGGLITLERVEVMTYRSTGREETS